MQCEANRSVKRNTVHIAVWRALGAQRALMLGHSAVRVSGQSANCVLRFADEEATTTLR